MTAGRGTDDRSVEPLGRFLLGGVLLIAGAAKARDLPAFASAVDAFGLVPERWTKGIAVAVPVSELLLGGLLMLGFLSGLAATAAAVLLIGFTVGIAISLVRGTDAPCGCFGADAAQPLDRSSVLRNLLLLAASVPVLLGAGTVRVASDWADYLAAALVAGMLVAGWQLLLGALPIWRRAGAGLSLAVGLGLVAATAGPAQADVSFRCCPSSCGGGCQGNNTRFRCVNSSDCKFCTSCMDDGPCYNTTRPSCP